MGNVFKDLTAGFSAFVLSWIVPSAVVVGIFAIFVFPMYVPEGKPPVWLAPVRDFTATGPVASTAVFALLVTVVALVASLASRPLYRLLEGYTLPDAIAKPMRKRQLLRQRRLQIDAYRRRRGFAHKRWLAREELENYPLEQSRVLPTRLGNALKALETYGLNHYGLDSQTFWYEIYGTAPQRNCQDADQARASVDFFISLVGLLAILSVSSTAVALATGSTQCWVVALGAVAMIRPAYSAAVRNMTDWRYAVQALINLGRPNLARGLGYRLPETLVEEQRFWSAWNSFVAERRSRSLTTFDRLRDQPADEAGPVAGLAAGGAEA